MLKLRIVFKMFKMCLVSEKGTLITKRDEQLFSRTSLLQWYIVLYFVF